MRPFLPFFVLIVLAFLVATPVAGQTDSYRAFRTKFSGEEDAHFFGVSGFIVRSVLAMTGEDEAREAARGIHRVRLAVVPRDAFREQQVTVRGFRQVLQQEAFDELMSFSDNGDAVTVYSNTPRRRDDQCYMMLVEAEDEVVLIEISGQVNEQYFKNLVKLHYQSSTL